MNIPVLLILVKKNCKRKNRQGKQKNKKRDLPPLSSRFGSATAWSHCFCGGELIGDMLATFGECHFREVVTSGSLTRVVV